MLSLSLLEKAEAKRAEDAKAKASAQTTGGYTVTGEGDPEVDALVMQRYEAKKAKNFARADEIRKSLLDEGIVLMDGPQGTTWRRI